MFCFKKVQYKSFNYDNQLTFHFLNPNLKKITANTDSLTTSTIFYIVQKNIHKNNLIESTTQ